MERDGQGELDAREQYDVHGSLPGPDASTGSAGIIPHRGGDLVAAATDATSAPEAPKVVVAGDDTVTVAYTWRSSAGRFEVRASWRDFENGTGQGRATRLTEDTGTFWFFDDDNLELVVKVVDGTWLNGHYWVFYGERAD